jgi:hypothetical protein
MPSQVIDVRNVALPLSKAILTIGRIAPAVLTVEVQWYLESAFIGWVKLPNSKVSGLSWDD